MTVEGARDERTRQSTRPPRMADVAQLAGVSLQTVSRALNGSDRISPGTKSRVLRIADEIGYRRNSLAHALATRRSGVVAIVATDMDQYGPRITMLNVEDQLRAARYGVSLTVLDSLAPHVLRDAVARAAAGGAEAVVVITSRRLPTTVAGVAQVGIPVVQVTGEASDEPLTAGLDQRRGARLATEHLIALGHRRIGHIAGPRGWVESYERVSGWREAMRSAGIEPGEVRWGRDWTSRSGYEIGRELLGSRQFTAVFAANDQVALGVCRAFLEAGLGVPEDLSVVGFDDLPEAAFYTPPLTTVRQDLAEVGRRAAELVVRALRGEREPRAAFVEPVLVRRGSSRALAT